jgi:hypothetical protein
MKCKKTNDLSSTPPRSGRLQLLLEIRIVITCLGRRIKACESRKELGTTGLRLMSDSNNDCTR